MKKELKVFSLVIFIFLLISLLASFVNADGWTADAKSGECASGQAMSNYDCTGSCSSDNSKAYCKSLPAGITIGERWVSGDSNVPSCPFGYIATGFDCGSSCGNDNMKIICRKLNNVNFGSQWWTADLMYQHDCGNDFVNKFDCTGRCNGDNMKAGCVGVTFACKSTGQICSSTAECCSNYCTPTDYDGAGNFCCNSGQCSHDGTCFNNATESGNYKCGSGTWKLKDGVNCTANNECYSNYCVHGTCRPSATYCGDNYCDTGENCPADVSSCGDSKCYEPSCTNGCVDILVANGLTDEACNVTSGCTNPPCQCDGNGNCISVPFQVNCTDSDNGINYTVKSITQNSTLTQNDYCFDDNKTLSEYYCVDITTIGQINYTCPGSCVNGTCVSVCGNGICEAGETALNCPSDCQTKCNADGTKWIFGNGTQADSLNNCKIESIAGTCCPLGHNCEQSGNNWYCAANNTFACFDYKTQSLCENYNNAVARYSALQITGKTCGSYIAEGQCYRGIDDCSCVWSSNSCNASYGVVRKCNGDHTILGTCNIVDDGSSECENDITTLKWKASWTGSGSVPAECKDGSKTILCRPTIKLPFFNFINVIVVIVLLVVIYSVYFHAKRNIRKGL